MLFIQVYIIKDCVFKINIYLIVFIMEKLFEFVFVVKKGEIIKIIC